MVVFQTLLPLHQIASQDNSNSCRKIKHQANSLWHGKSATSVIGTPSIKSASIILKLKFQLTNTTSIQSWHGHEGIAILNEMLFGLEFKKKILPNRMNYAIDASDDYILWLMWIPAGQIFTKIVLLRMLKIAPQFSDGLLWNVAFWIMDGQTEPNHARIISR